MNKGEFNLMTAYESMGFWPNCVLTHGQSGCHAHTYAWLELGHEVFCLVTKRHYTRDEYYAEAQIRDVVRYTRAEAIALHERTGHYGPWPE